MIHNAKNEVTMQLFRLVIAIKAKGLFEINHLLISSVTAVIGVYVALFIQLELEFHH